MSYSDHDQRSARADPQGSLIDQAWHEARTQELSDTVIGDALSAADDMLAALEAVLATHWYNVDGDDSMKARRDARAAIAKARGEG